MASSDLAASAVVIIPTYWTWPSSEAQQPTTAAYDHPTPLDSGSTLPPLLEDLACQRRGPPRVLILLGLAHPALGEAASRHLREILAPYRGRLDLRLCDSAAFETLKETLQPSKLQSELIHLNGYAGIRNLQLLVPHVLGAGVVIALDDDERVEPDYVERAVSHMGEVKDGERVLGLAGPYLQPDGGVLLKEGPRTGNVFRDKAHHINAAMRMLTRQTAGLVSSPMALGGNMVFHRELFTRVCFDPGITRGEDIDYLINARLLGIRWWFDPELRILHLPPRQHEAPAYQRTREDVFRFIYERQKLRLAGVSRPPWLEPYPGALLGADLEQHASSALRADSTPQLMEALGAPSAILDKAHQHAERDAARYTDCLAAWRELLDRIEQDAALRSSAQSAFPPL